jgi:hypothetical protein
MIEKIINTIELHFLKIYFTYESIVKIMKKNMRYSSVILSYYLIVISDINSFTYNLFTNSIDFYLHFFPWQLLPS